MTIRTGWEIEQARLGHKRVQREAAIAEETRRTDNLARLASRINRLECLLCDAERYLGAHSIAVDIRKALEDTL